MAKNKIQVINGVYPVSVDEAIYIASSNKKLSDELRDIKNAQGNSANLDNYWKGKKVVIIGDSYSDPSNSHPKWYPYLESMLGIEIVRNYSVGGYRISKTRYTKDEASGEITGSVDEYNHVQKVDSYDFTDADIVIICTAINDFFSNVPFDKIVSAYQSVYTKDFDTTTFTGAYEYILRKVFTKATTSTQKTPLVILCTPTNSKTLGAYKNDIGLTPSDYADEVRRIADAWGCAVCDWIRGSGWNADTVYSNTRSIKGVASDGCHPNEWGAERLGRMVVNTIKMY